MNVKKKREERNCTKVRTEVLFGQKGRNEGKDEGGFLGAGSVLSLDLGTICTGVFSL